MKRLPTARGADGMVVEQAEVRCPRCDSVKVREEQGWASDGEYMCLYCGYGFRDGL